MIPVIVSGGAGYVGSHVCKYLRANGYNPITVDNLSRGHADAVKWGPLEIGDIRDKHFLRNVFLRHKPVAVVHLAALAYVGESVEMPAEYYENNVSGTIALLGIMKEFKVENLVFSSSCAVYGDRWQNEINELCEQQPSSPYGRSKAMCEQIIRDYSKAYGMRAIVLRYFNAAGADPGGEIGEGHNPETHLIPLVLDAAATGTQLVINGMDYPTPDGTCVRDYIHVWDLAQAHHLALGNLLARDRSNEFNLGSGRGFSILEIVKATEELTSKPIQVSHGPRRDGDAASAVCYSGHARDVLGWAPRYSDLKTILETAWNWRNKK